MKSSKKHKPLSQTMPRTLPLLHCSILLLLLLLFIISSCSTVSFSTDLIVSGCPDDITKPTAAAGETMAEVTWSLPTAVDYNDMPIPGTGISISTDPVTALTNPPEAGNAFKLGKTIVTVTFTDDAGNSSSCRFTVTVSPAVTVLNCPADLVKLTAPAEETALVTWSLPTAVDYNDVAIPGTGISISTDPVTALTYPPEAGNTFMLGKTTVTVTFTDDAGNSDDSCTFTVTISQPASTVIKVSACPEDSRLAVSASDTTALVAWTEPTAVDSNENAIPSTGITTSTDPVTALTYPPEVGNAFMLGKTTITITFTDDAGNSDDSCTFTVTVSKPVTVFNCPADLVKLTAPAEETAFVTWTEPTAVKYDATPLMITAQTHSQNDPFPLGSTTVITTFTDDDGNSDDSCRFTVTISQPPASTDVTINNCPVDITQISLDASQTSIVTWTEPTAFNSNGVEIPFSHIISTASSGDAFSIGSTTVTYTFLGLGEGTSSGRCSFTVTIEPRPTITYEFYLENNTAEPSSENPFLIETSADLKTLASVVNDKSAYTLSGTDLLYAAATYRLETSLDLGTDYTHIPIGSCGDDFDEDGNVSLCGSTKASPFIGTFDGNEKTLTNLSYSNSHSALGLFSVISSGARLFDLTLKDPSMTNTISYTNFPASPTGALVGFSGGDSVISNVNVIGGSIKGNKYVGGIVGRLSSGNIILSNVSLIAGTIEGLIYVGGIAGALNSGLITASSATGTVTGTEGIGGLVGSLGGGSITISTSTMTATAQSNSRADMLQLGGLVGNMVKGNIIASSATGETTGGKQVGGLVGLLGGGSIRGSYSTGETTGQDHVGGLVGLNSSSITNSYATGAVTGNSNVGGLVGWNPLGTITNSYAAGAVTGNSHVGGLVGSLLSGSITASYWDTTTSGILDTGTTFGAGYPTSNLQIPHVAGYSTWDDPPWIFERGQYPSFLY